MHVLLLLTVIQGRSSAAPSANPGRVAEAVAVATRSASPKVDGRLDDAVWSRAQPFSGFRQRDPDEGAPGSEPTEVRVLYSDDALYIGVRALDSDARRIAAPLARRDETPASDWVGVMIDSYYDRRTAFEFAVNPAGVKRDVFHYNDGEQDITWDAVWDVAVSRDSLGWSAEFRIPFSQLRFARGSDRRFGFNVWREINRKSERQYWRLIPKSATGIASLFGDLVGFDKLTPPRRLEVAPYTLAGRAFRSAEAGNPFRTGSASRLTGGADLRFGLTSNLTLSAALNPDFGQVEADPAVVNLSTTETFYPERRPFFTEGSDVFKFRISASPWSNEQLFYTRRIGRPPQLTPDPRGGFAQEVGETTILGATKIQGKTPGGWTVGVLGALTAEETASVLDKAGTRFKDIVEPRSEYGVMRFSKDLRNGRTVIGGFATAVRRDLSPALTGLRSDAYAGGVELVHRFSRDRYTLRASLIGSRVSGSREAMVATQRSPVHSFQRPDIGYASVDSTRTSLAGAGGYLEIHKDAGSWLWGFHATSRSPGLELNDAGYQTDAARTDFLTWMSHRWLTPGRVFRQASLRSNQWAQWGYDGRIGDHGFEVISNVTLKNYWTVNLYSGHQMAGSNPQSLEGGPSLRYPGGGWIGTVINTDPRSAVRLGVNLDAWDAFEGPGHGRGAGATVAWRPSSRLELSVGPHYALENPSRQFVAAADAAGRTEYIVGELRQNTVSVPTRGNFTFTPALSFQLYAEPFVSSGHYRQFKRVTNPEGNHEADRFDVLGEDRLIRTGDNVAVDLDRNGVADFGLGAPDFTVLSLRSTAVLRWEYRPASTIILVWQQQRGRETADGRFHFGESVGDIFRADARNTLLLKISHWFSVK